jgi:16S rRNA (cytidine1402-2'-O)-methyltransferase
MLDKGLLSVVATPIGNLEDITFRAVRVLKECDYILCEDTRVTGKLCKHYGIETPLRRYDAHASEQTHQTIIDDISAGKHVAMVSDAGTPGVSDPGVLLVGRARAVGARIEAIPGPSAVTTAFSIAGLSGNQFSFLGFVPQKKGRQTFFASLEEYDHPVIFFESTHRIVKTLEALNGFSAGAKVTMAREMTKLHEEVLVGSPAELLTILESNPIKQKGEFVLIVS